MITKTTLALVTLGSISLLSNASPIFDQGKRFLESSLEIYTSPNPPTQEALELQFKCQYLVGLNFYDLQNLALASSYYTFTNGTSSILASFCNDLPAAQSCDTTSTMAVAKTATETCVSLTGSDPTADADFDVDDQDNNEGLKIHYKNGGVCKGDATKNYDFTIHIQCDSSATSMTNINVDDGFSNGGDGCTKVVSFKHETGCKNDSLNALWEWFNSNKWVMFSVFLIIGSIICFLGRTLFKPVLFISGMFLSVCLVWLIFYSTFLSSNTKPWVGWVVLVGSILLGLLIGAIFVKLAKLGAFILAAWGGFSVSLLIYNAFLYKMDSQVGFWCFTIGVALIFGVLALFFFEHILIHSTAILGSFMAVYGIGLVAGHYQNPFTLAALIKHGEITSIDPIFYAYLAGNLVMYILGVFYQYRQRKGDKETGHDPYNRLR